MAYELFIHANWGISHPDRRLCPDRKTAMRAFDEVILGDAGGVVTVRLYDPSGKLVREKKLDDR